MANGTINDQYDGESMMGETPVHDRAVRRVRRRRRYRVQLDLLAEIYDRVLQVQKINGLESTRAVFRHAFRLYEWYTIRRAEGWAVQLIHKDGRVAYVDLGLDGERPTELPRPVSDSLQQHAFGV